MGWYALPVVLCAIGVVQLIRKRIVPGIIVVAIVFTAFGAMRSPESHSIPVSPELAMSSGAIGEIEGFPKPAISAERAILRLQEVCVGESCVEHRGCVVAYIPLSDRPLSRGDVVRLDWRLDTLSSLGSGYRNFVEGFGCSGSARATRVSVIERGPAPFQWLASARHGIEERLAAELPGDVGALATGIVTGDDSELSDEAREAFRLTGTAHVTAVSGQNVSLILAFMMMWWTPRARKLRIAFSVLIILVVWIYAALVGLEPPATRAAIMATLLVIGNHTGRRPDPLTLLALTLGGMALWTPDVVRGVGFWLSALATFGLVMVMPLTRPSMSKHALLRLALGPMVASLATLPLIIATFQSWSPITILANMLLSPVITLAFPLSYGFAALTWLVPGIASVLAFVPGIVLDTALSIVTWLAPISGNLRFGEIDFPTMLVMMVLILAWIALASPESERWIRRISKTFLGR